MLQYIFTAGDYGLRKPKMLSVSNVNLIVLKWQNIDVISNIKSGQEVYFTFSRGVIRISNV